MRPTPLPSTDRIDRWTPMAPRGACSRPRGYRTVSFRRTRAMRTRRQNVDLPDPGSPGTNNEPPPSRSSRSCGFARFRPMPFPRNAPGGKRRRSRGRSGWFPAGRRECQPVCARPASRLHPRGRAWRRRAGPQARSTSTEGCRKVGRSVSVQRAIPTASSRVSKPLPEDRGAFQSLSREQCGSPFERHDGAGRPNTSDLSRRTRPAPFRGCTLLRRS
jgi:hypothetical protein